MYSLGQYLYDNSVIHRLDPRVKILSVIALSIIILKATLYDALLISLFLALTAFATRAKLTCFFDALRPLAPFLILLFFLHLFFTAGRPLIAFPGITLSSEGLYQGFITTWQFAALVAGASILTLTTSPSELISGIERLLRPFNRFGLPSHDIAVMISLALRFVPTLLEEAENVRNAQLSRGADFRRGNILQRIRAVSAFAVILSLGYFRRAEELARAMEGRGYERGPRTYSRELRMAPSDYAAFALVILFLSGIHLLDYVKK